MNESTLELADYEEARLLFGPQDRNLRLVRERFGVDIVARGARLTVSGADSDAVAAHEFLSLLLTRARSEGALHQESVVELLDATRPARKEDAAAPPSPGERSMIEGVRLRTPGQRAYVKLIEENDIVFSIGPAGTGKTFLAVLMAVEALKRGRVEKLVLCRPAVEAGEKLGYLPGDFHAKVNPYMRPLYDALHALLDFDTVKKYIEREVIEVVPLAYMRGRTLSKAFIILDEAQNTTRAQMKMFLTRMGEGSKIVVTGDVTQVDLPKGVTSGLVHAEAILQDVEGIGFIHLTSRDIVRHALVWRVIQAFEGQKRPSGKKRKV